MKKLISITILSLAPLYFAQASTDAWVFSHRANTPAAIDASINDLINAVEMDVTLRRDIPLSSVTESCKNETWCTYHSGDDFSYGLSDMLMKINQADNLAAVWLDVKSLENVSSTQYESLIGTVNNVLGTEKEAIKRFWGVFGASELKNTYTETVRSSFSKSGGDNNNLFIIEADRRNDITNIQKQCQQWGVQCGVSVGNPFFGLTGSEVIHGDVTNVNLISGVIEHEKNINSVFFWTFNYDGEFEDDLIRLAFEGRDYWEYLFGYVYHCGQEANGVIVGYLNSVYDSDFCESGVGDYTTHAACQDAKKHIESGPNQFGNRLSNIGQPRDQYIHKLVYKACDVYYK